MKIISILMSLSLFSLSALAATNETIQSFSKAKKLLETEVYQSNRTTLYCGASFDAEKNIIHLPGFHTDKHVKRSKRVEWEHVVPAETLAELLLSGEKVISSVLLIKGKHIKVESVLIRQMLSIGICKLICTTYFLRRSSKCDEK